MRVCETWDVERSVGSVNVSGDVFSVREDPSALAGLPEKDEFAGLDAEH